MRTSSIRINSSIHTQTPEIAKTSPSTGQAQTAVVQDAYVAPSRAASSVLPPKVAQAKAEVMKIAAQNTDNVENIKAVRAQLQPHLKTLSEHFAKNRPANEVELTRGTWQNIWYDDPDIDRGPGFLKLDRNRIWQVVGKDFYTNVAESKLKLFGLRLGTIQSFLKGNYKIAEELPPAPGEDQPRKNVINLEFAENRAFFGKLSSGANLQDTVKRVESGDKWTLPVPGPKGIQGELWNLYVDQDIRISAGIQKGESKSEGIDLYVLRRGELS